MIDEKQQRREHTLEWIAAGLVAFFIFAGVAFYSFSVDVRNVGAPSAEGLIKSSTIGVWAHSLALTRSPRRREREQGWRNLDAKGLCRFEIDDERELSGLLHCQVGGLGPFRDLIGIFCGATVDMPPIRSIRDQTTCLCRVPVNVHRRQPELCREIRQWQPIETLRAVAGSVPYSAAGSPRHRGQPTNAACVTWGEAKTGSAFSASALFWGLPADASAKYPAWASAAALQPRLRGLCCWVAIPPTLRS